MDLERIKFCIEAMAASDLAEMEFSEGGWSLRLVRRARDARPPPTARPTSPPKMQQAARAPVAPSEPAHDPRLLSPMFGVVYLRPDPNSPEFVSPGMKVAAGTPLCIIEAMKVFNEVRAEREGTIAAILVSSGDEVEAGQELMRFA